MKDKISQVWQKVKDFFAKMSKKVKTVLIVTLVIVIAGAAGAAVFLNTRPYVTLFSGLSTEDMANVLTYMDENGITSYKVQNNDTILVPESQEASLTAKLIMQGYPSSGFSYSMYLDNVSSLSTESDRRTLYLFDLQNRMAAVIRCMDGVKDAVVNIAQGEDRRYVLDSSNTIEASASVMVTMQQSGQKLTNQQAGAIRNYIAQAVQGLNIDNVSISDSAGNEYPGETGDTTYSDNAQLKMSLEKQVNDSVRSNVLEVIVPLFGAENVSVSVNSTVDVSRSFVESVTYTEPDWAADGSTGGEGIIGSKVYDHTIIRGDDATPGGVVGAETNSDLTTYVENESNPDGTEKQINVSGETDYNVDTRKEQTDVPAGIVTDVMVSVSINSTSAGDFDADRLLRHVARAAGIGADVEVDKISILPMPFYITPDSPNPTTDDGTGFRKWVFYALIAGAALFLLLLFLLIFLRRRKKKKNRNSNNAFIPPMPDYSFDVPYSPPPDMGANIMQVNTEKSMELRKDVRQFAESNPEIAAQMVKSWLRGGEENNG